MKKRSQFLLEVSFDDCVVARTLFISYEEVKKIASERIDDAMECDCEPFQYKRVYGEVISKTAGYLCDKWEGSYNKSSGSEQVHAELLIIRIDP